MGMGLALPVRVTGPQWMYRFLERLGPEAKAWTLKYEIIGGLPLPRIY